MIQRLINGKVREQNAAVGVKLSMYNSTPVTNKFLFALCGLTFGIPAVFFGYLTARLVYLVVMAENGEMYRTGETMMAAVGFPGMFLLLAVISRWFLKKAFVRPLE